MISDGHDMFCGCTQPFAHLLDSIFPEGHTDRNKPINYIIKRDLQLCLSGGPEEKDHGIPLGGSAANAGFLEEEEKPTKEDIEELLEAAAAAERQER